MLKETLKARWFALARWVCRVFCILFFRLRTYGRENIPATGPFILVGNHQSYLDPIFCGAPVKRHMYFLARHSLFDNQFLAALLASVNTIPVKREKAEPSAIKEVIGKLKQGRGLCLFPEGTRTADGKIAPFRPGLGLLCRRTGAALVPVLIDGAFECWPRHKKIFSPGPITVRYGRAITTEKLKTISDRELAELLTDTLRRMQTNYRKNHGKKPYNYGT